MTVVRKFSQIAPSGGIPALTDQLVGVGGGATDLLYNVQQVGLAIAPGPPANGNLDFYVATAANGGLDTNTGDITHPFLTIQRAVNVGASYNYQGVYTLAIHIGAGTFNPGSSIAVNLPPTINYPANQFGPKIIGAGPASTTVKGQIGFAFHGALSFWSINQLTVDSSVYAFFVDAGGNGLVQGGSIAIIDSSNGGGNTCFNCNSGGFQCVTAAIDISTLTAMTAFARDGSGGGFSLTACDINFPSANFGGGWWFECFNGPSAFSWNPGVLTNAAKWIGARVNVGEGTIIATGDGTYSTIPGVTNFDVFDETCISFNSNSGDSVFTVNQSNTPAALASGTTNNYTIIEPNHFQRITANAANSVLTGVLFNVGQQGRAQADGWAITLVNIGTGTLTLNHQDAGSTKTNRFNNSTGAAIVLSTGQAADLLYDKNAANGTDNTGAWLVFKRN